MGKARLLFFVILLAAGSLAPGSLAARPPHPAGMPPSSPQTATAGAAIGGLPRRDLRMMLVADEEYQRRPGWAKELSTMIKAVSDHFEKLFNIRLTAQPFESWRSDDRLIRIDVAAESLVRDLDRGGADLLVVMSGQEWAGDERMSYAMFKEGLIFLAPPPQLSDLAPVFERLLGRLFGAVTAPPDPHEEPPWDPSKPLRHHGASGFSVENREIILLNRDRTFNRPDSPAFPAATDRAIELYRSICASIERAAAAREAERAAVLAGQPEDGEALRVRPIGASDAHLLLAQLYLNAGRLDEAMAFCAGAIRLDPDDLEAQNTIGIIYRRTGDPETAIGKYLGIFKQDPQFARVLFNMGVAYAQQGDLKNAQSAYEAAVALKPAYAEAHNNIGDIRLRQGRFEDAEACFRRAIAARPGLAVAHANLAGLILRNGDIAGAGVEADEAARLDPRLAFAPLIQGNVDRAGGRTDEAVAHYLQAKAIDPKNERAAVNLGICAFGRGAFEESERFFREALALNPGSAEAHAGLGACLLKRRELDPAFQELQAALALGPGTAEVHLNLSSIALEKKRYDEAIAQARAALALAPATDEAYRNLGAAYLQKGLKRESAEAYAAAARIARDKAGRALSGRGGGPAV